MRERRRYVRSNGLVVVHYKTEDPQISGKCSAFDISGAGVRITIEHELKIAALLEIEIYLPGSSEPIFAKGEVVWVQQCKQERVAEIMPDEEYFYTGVRFTVIDEKNKNKITNYVHRKILGV